MDRFVRPDELWELSPLVALRPESFGALAYHFGNRRLTFLKHPSLAAVLRNLGGGRSVGQAIEMADVPESMHLAVLASLQNLAETDMIRPTANAGDGDVDVA